MGASRSEIAQVRSRGYSGWIEDQFQTPRGQTLWEYLVAQGYSDPKYVSEDDGFEPAMWRALIAEPDHLRQRIAMTLLQIMVVGIQGVQVHWTQFAMAAYVDLLFDHAFGNFRILLGKVATNVAMGSYLSFANNRKANATTGSQPDENFARELMQLFTIGLRQLNMDGSEKIPAQDTYNQADVTGLARIFTGLIPATWDVSSPEFARQPMAVYAPNHEMRASSFLGTTVPEGTDGSTAIGIALDTLFAHPNVPPFISRQFIQRLVTSNPSGAYVARVAAAFVDNGKGERGDLKAVTRAVLLDNEARSISNDANTGKLREPVLRLTGWARAFGLSSPSNSWAIGDTSSQVNRLGQSMGRSSSVFNWYRPGYAPPNTSISSAGLVAPEFQIANEVSNVAYINYMQLIIANGIGDTKPQYSSLLTLAGDSAALVAEINLLLACGQLANPTLDLIRGAVNSIATDKAFDRVCTGILLCMASPEYLILR